MTGILITRSKCSNLNKAQLLYYNIGFTASYQRDEMLQCFRLGLEANVVPSPREQ